ncbi:MAG: hypothetical protein WCI73_08390, partial [Phycisphaerae bacterium]
MKTNMSRQLTTQEERKTMKSSSKRFHSALILAGVVAASLAQSAMANTTFNFNASNVAANWSLGANWGGTAPAPSTSTNNLLDLIFSGFANSTFANNDFTAGSIFNNITLGNTSTVYTLNGNSIVLDGNMTIQTANPVAGVVNLNMDLGGGVRTFSVGLNSFTGGHYVWGDAYVNGIISNGGITKINGNTGGIFGRLYLTGANTYQGVTTITNGEISVATLGGTQGAGGGTASNLGAAGNAAANLVFNTTAGALQYTGVTASTDRNFTINANMYATFDITKSGTNLTWTGAANGGIASTNGSIAKTGLGTLTFTTAQNNTGTNYVNGGTLALDFSQTGAATSNILNSASALNFAGLGTNNGGSIVASATLNIIGKGGTTNTANSQTFASLSAAPPAEGSVAAHLNLSGGTAGNPLNVIITNGLSSFVGNNNGN